MFSQPTADRQKPVRWKPVLKKPLYSQFGLVTLSLQKWQTPALRDWNTLLWQRLPTWSLETSPHSHQQASWVSSDKELMNNSRAERPLRRDGSCRAEATLTFPACFLLHEGAAGERWAYTEHLIPSCRLLKDPLICHTYEAISGSDAIPENNCGERFMMWWHVILLTYTCQ